MENDQPQPTTKTILVVEDEAAIGALLTETILQETPYQLVLVSDGLQALNVMQDITPHLFIFNYQLPSINGIELYDRVQRMKAFAHVPTIMMSARLPKQELAKRGIIGMEKPFDLSELLETIEKLIA